MYGYCTQCKETNKLIIMEDEAGAICDDCVRELRLNDNGVNDKDFF